MNNGVSVVCFPDTKTHEKAHYNSTSKHSGEVWFWRFKNLLSNHIYSKQTYIRNGVKQRYDTVKQCWISIDEMKRDLREKIEKLEKLTC